MSDSSRALMVRVGCALALLVAAACGRNGPHDGALISAEPRESADTEASVRAEAEQVTSTALDMWSRALPAMSSDAPHELIMNGTAAGTDGVPDEEQMRHEPVGTTSLTGADMPASGAPSATTSPRSASEAAERSEGATGRGTSSDVSTTPTTPAGSATAVPKPVAPTSPAETTDPSR